MRVLDLFSGIGGFSLGLMAANYENYDFTLFPNQQKAKSDGFFSTAAFCEIDKEAREVLAARFAGVPIFDDICEIAGAEDLGRIDIITGGFPCQDLSTAGRMAGLNGARSSLFYEMMRVARIFKPKYILFENVTELLTNVVYHQAFSAELASSGYQYTAFILSAAHFGLAHKRQRAFILAHRAQKRCDGFKEIFAKNYLKMRDSGKTEQIDSLRAAYNEAGWRERAFSTIKDLRGDDGLSSAVVRCGLCGNAIVPQIACCFGLAIKEIEGAGG